MRIVVYFYNNRGKTISYMLNYFLSRYKSIQTRSFLTKPVKYKKAYAVIGTGQHSITNLYPCIWHLGIPVKKIYSATKKNADDAAARWNNCQGTNDIEAILNDSSITGVIVAVPAGLQAGMVKKLLEHGKQVFAEKPIGYSLEELKSLIKINQHGICQAGLQRRFAPVIKILKEHCKNVYSYNYRFCTGAYPEGDSIYDIFIHPVDNVIQLFGKAEIEHMSVQKASGGETWFLFLNHNGIKGSIELSTHYSWRQSLDEMTVNTATKIFTIRYPGHVSAITKPATLLHVPLEKITRQPVHSHVYLDNTGFIPVAEMNSLQLLGFYPELLNFVTAVERGNATYLEKLESLLPAYEILERMKTAG